MSPAFAHSRVIQPVEAGEGRLWTLLFVGWILQAGLAVAMKQMPALGLLHVLAFTFYALYVAATAKQADQIAIVAAYGVGADVLWRMCKASLFWEYGKYMLAVLFIIGLIRARHVVLPKGALLYFGLLLPAAVIPFTELKLDQARQEVSFNLSGPFTLALSVIFFSTMEVGPRTLRNIGLALATPTIGIAAITAFTTYTTEELRFSADSNLITSGGFGPNQVSAVLGLGALMLCIIITTSYLSKYKTLALGGFAFILLVQCVMTFSRGGLYVSGGALAAFFFFAARDRRGKMKQFLPILAIAVVAGAILFPVLNAFTGGALFDRVQQTDVTHRDELMQQDLELLEEHPIFGAGVGMSRFAHRSGLTAHTEQTRLLAEHGAFGIIALITVLAMAATRFLQTNSLMMRAFVTSMLFWVLLYMAANGMRIAAPSFVFGLAFLRYYEE